MRSWLFTLYLLISWLVSQTSHAQDSYYVVVGYSGSSYTVQAANHDTTACPGKASSTLCKIARIDYTALGWPKPKQTTLDRKLRKGGILFGSLQQNSNGKRILVAREAWLPRLKRHALQGGFYAVQDSGIVCVKSPCPHWQETLLNSATPQLISDLEFNADEKLHAEIQGILAQLGTVLAMGVNQTGMAEGDLEESTKLVASQVYTLAEPKPGAKPKARAECLTETPDQCADGQRCEANATRACGKAKLPGTCSLSQSALTSTICTTDYNPVCGCDGQTYSNDCERQKAGVALDHAGGCAYSQIAPQQRVCIPAGPYRPVCGADGKTYGSECELNNAGVALLHQDICEGDTNFCSAQYDPVCGTDGRTYTNDCFRKQAGVELKNTGICELACISVYSPVCGVDGKTYGNRCELIRAGMTASHDGECAATN